MNHTLSLLQAKAAESAKKYKKELADLKYELACKDEKLKEMEDLNRAQKLETQNFIQRGKDVCEKALAFQAQAAAIGKEFEGNQCFRHSVVTMKMRPH